MMIDNNFFLDTHIFLKKIATDIIIPNIGKLSENEVSTKEDNSKVTSYDVIIENELIEYFKNMGFSNIISEEGNSKLIKINEGDKNYTKMSDNYEKSLAFKTACDLIFKGTEQPSGYTEPLLHLNRLEKKSIQN